MSDFFIFFSCACFKISSPMEAAQINLRKEGLQQSGLSETDYAAHTARVLHTCRWRGRECAKNCADAPELCAVFRARFWLALNLIQDSIISRW
jgi:hypothetical protein